MTTQEDGMAEYWDGLATQLHNNHALEFRARLALVLVEKWGTVAAHTDGEDTVGRWKLELQSPTDLVARCFAIAEEFVRVAEEKGLLRQPSELPEELAARIGELHGYQRMNEYAVSLRDRKSQQQAPVTG